MSLGEWATTLFDLSATGTRESHGILGGGVSALYAGAFGAGGQLLENGETEGQPIGVALAARTLAVAGDASQAKNAFNDLVKLRRRDGTISLAASDDTVSQAYFALAFAQMPANTVGPA